LYLEVRNLSVLYDRALVLNKVDIHVNEKEMISLVGPNGAGKTTLLRAISGLVKWEKEAYKGTVGGKITMEGDVIFDGEDVSNLPAHEIVKRGLVFTPERGRPLKEMTIRENLEAGAYLIRDKTRVKENLEKIYQLFPVLKKREKQISGTISGGERTMLAIGRSLMSHAKFLLIDEPSVGLAPKVKDVLFERIRDVHGMGITILLTEQDIGFAFDLASRNYVLSQGQIVAEGDPEQLLADDMFKRTYLGL
jgi:branched-chain amino acid transport system ATP-binding protein